MDCFGVSSVKINFDYSPGQTVFATVVGSEYCETRLEHEELVYLDNGITLELKWGGPFRCEGAYEPGEEVGLVYDQSGQLNVIRYRMGRPVCQERFVACSSHYYISDI